jgi:hypothetical protein
MLYAVIILILVLLAGVIAAAIATKGCKDDSSMPVAQRWLLVCYLLSIGACLVYLIATLGSVDFPDAATIVNPSSLVQETVAPDAPLLKYVFPQCAAVKPPDPCLTLYGQNFPDGATVRINSTDHITRVDEKGVLLSVPLQQSDLTGVSALTVAVVNPADKKISNAVIVPVTRPRAPLKLLGLDISLTREGQLLLLIICAGALGSYVHAIRSLTNFIGNRTVVASWFWWYIARPFIGMSMALIFYAALRGGFLAGTPADAKFVNPFGVVTIGALVGMFSDKAAQKLAEIFDTLFRAEDNTKDKLTSPIIEKLVPDHVRPGTTPPPEIIITGSHLSSIQKVRVNQQDRAPKSVSDQQVKIVLAPADLAQAGQIDLSLVDKSGTVISAGMVLVTDLDISDPPGTPGVLPPGTKGQPYAQKITATGGTPPYVWDFVGESAGLAIEKESGQLSGTPKSGDFAITIKVTDSKNLSVTKTFKLKVE